jgi:hypothetical protein
MGYAHADKLIGIHVNLLSVRREPDRIKNPTPEERVFLDQLNHLRNEEIGYQRFRAPARRRRDRTVILPLFLPAPSTLDDPGRRGRHRADCLRRIPEGDPENSVLIGRVHIYEHSPLDGDAGGRAFHRNGAT